MLIALSPEVQAPSLAVPGTSSGIKAGPSSPTTPSVVSITSVVTTTVHPTLLYTEVTTVNRSLLETSWSSAGQSYEREKSHGPAQLQPVRTNANQTPTVQLSMSPTIQLIMTLPELTQSPSVSLTPTVAETTEASSTSDGLALFFSLAALTSTTFSSATASTTASAGLGMGVISIELGSTSTLVTSGRGQLISTTRSSSSPSPSPTPDSLVSPSPSAPSVAGIIANSSPTDGQLSQSKSSSHVGAIVGGSIGGAVALCLALLVCILCLRRRRPVTKSQGHGRRSLLRDSSDSLAFLRARAGQNASPPRFPMAPIPISSPYGSCTPANPVTAPNQALPNHTQQPWLNTMALHRDTQGDSFPDPDGSPVSPIINVHPPSRTASTYSQLSCEDGMWILEKPDNFSPVPSSHYESVSYADESIVPPVLPRPVKLAPWEDRKTRLSTRSDPFDLELPPKALHEWPLPPRPTPWGDEF